MLLDSANAAGGSPLYDTPMLSIAFHRAAPGRPVSRAWRSPAHPRQRAVAATTLGYLLFMAVACGYIPFVGGDDAVEVVEADSAEQEGESVPGEPEEPRDVSDQDQSNETAASDAGVRELQGPAGGGGDAAQAM